MSTPAFLRRHGSKLVFPAIVPASLVYALKKGGIKFIPDGGNFDHVRWWTLPAYLVVFLAMTWYRAVRWRFLLRSFAEIPKRRLYSVSAIGFAAILLMPV